jgi:hypothetical protein
MVYRVVQELGGRTPQVELKRSFQARNHRLGDVEKSLK